MEYKRFNDRIVARLDTGEEIIEKLKEIALKENIKLASVEAIGASDYFVVGIFDLAAKHYNEHEFKGAHEIVNLTGNINTMNGQYYSHLHITCANENGQCVGGHLNKAIISATCEMFINIIDGVVDRYRDENRGLNLFKFN